MDGNHSLLAAVSLLINCEDAKAPFIINIVLGLPVNMCVMWFISAGPRDKASEMSSLNQAVCEVLIGIANVIQLIAINNATFKFVNLTYLGYTVRFSLGLLYSGRPLFMSWVCLERYLAVVRPVTFLKYKLLRYRLAGSVISWLSVLVCCIILIWVPLPATPYVCFSMSLGLFPMQVFCCVETLRALMRSGPGNGNQKSNEMNNGKLRAFRIILIILVSEGVTFLPYITGITFYYYFLRKESSILFCIATYTSMVDGFIPPFYYIHKAGKLQHCFRNIAT